MSAFGYLAAVVLLGAWAHASHLIAARLLPQAAAHARTAAAAAVGFALLVVVFGVLSPFRLFRLEAALPLWLGLAGIAHLTLGRGEARGAVRRDLESLRSAWREAGWARWVALAALPVAVRTVRGLIAPPLAWDAITYHLPKAGEWVQAGGFVPLAGPGTNRGYDFVAPYGDVLWAWAMLPVHGDALLAPAGLLVWLGVALAAYACARSLGIPVRTALLAALAVALTPTAAALITTAYVDNTVLLAFLLGCTFAIRALERPTRVDSLLAGLSFGLMAGTKMTGVVVAAAWALVALGVAIRRRDASVWPGVLAAVAIGAPPYLRSWIATGNPLYPIEVALGSHVIFPGLTRLGEEGARGFSWLRFLGNLSTPFITDDVPYRDIRGGFDRIALGPAAMALAPVGVAGAVALARRGRGLVVLLLAVLCAAVVATQISSAKTFWTVPLIKTTQRYVLAIPACLAILAASLGRRWIDVALAVAAVLGGALSLPRGIGPGELAPLGWAAIAALAAVAIAWFAATGAALRARPAVAAAVALLGIGLALASLEPVRARCRYDVYRDASHQQAFDMHYLQPLASLAWPIWSALDRTDARFRVAAAGGANAWWFRYPLLGSRLQNDFVYVSPTADGTPFDGDESISPTPSLSFDAWLRRLVGADVDVFVALWPLPPEMGWVFTHTDLFAPVAASEDGRTVAFAFDKARALRVLTAQAAGR